MYVPGGKVTRTFAPGKGPHGIALSVDGRWLLVSSRQTSEIWVIDPETLKAHGENDIGRGMAHQMFIRQG